MEMVRIAVAKDFNRFPGGRHPRHGPGNGEEFRDKFLLPPLRKGEKVVVLFDDAAGFPASFLEEAFGGLVRAGFSSDELNNLLTIEVSDSDSVVYRDEAWQYIKEESDREKIG